MDEKWYLEEYTDVQCANQDPAEHYVRYGAAEGRNPHPDFDTSYYLQSNQDVADSGWNPFHHYIVYGRSEGRPAKPPAPDHEEEARPSSGGKSLLSVLPARDWRANAPLRDMPLTEMQCHDQMPIAVDWRAVTPSEELSQDTDLDFARHVLKVANGKTLSLDVWDTLLRRNCHPDETKLRSARALWLLLPDAHKLHPVDIYQIRRIAEATVADLEHEYRLADVVREWLSLLGQEQAHAATMIEQEMAIELSCTSADNTLSSVLEQHGSNSIVVSDFYMPADQLSRILEHNGVTISGEIYVSCDYMKTKRSGEIFDIVLQKEGLSPPDIVHVGDRMDADVIKPRSRGLSAIQYHNPWHLQQTEDMQSRLNAHLEGDFGPHAHRLIGLSVGSLPGRKEPAPLETMAITAVGFVLSVLQDAVRRQVDRVFFFSREGIFFKELYDGIVAQDILDLGEYPASVVLDVSRRATFAASLEAFSIPELMRIWSQYSSQSLHALAVSLNIDPSDWASAAQACGLDMQEEIAHPWEDPRIKAFLTNRGVVASTQHSLREQRQDLITYLDRIGFATDQNKTHMIVDIGWRGTIQDNIARLCAGNVVGHYLGLENFLNKQSANSIKSGYLFDRRNKSDSFVVSDHAAFEFLFNATGGSVVGYDSGVPVKAIIAAEERIIEADVSDFQSRLRKAAVQVARYVRDHGLIAEDLRAVSRWAAESYTQYPPVEVTSAFLAYEHNETFGTGQVDKISLEEGGVEEIREKQGAQLHAALERMTKSVRWLEAQTSSGDLGNVLQHCDESQRVNLPSRLTATRYLAGASFPDNVVCVASPKPIKGSGGHRTIYNMCRRLSELGFKVHLMNESPGNSSDMAWQLDILAGSGIVLHNEWVSTIKASAAVATIAHSASYINKFFRETSKCFYFIQDHEAFFNPAGDVFLDAQCSYAEGLQCITIGSWLGHVLSVQYGIGAASGGLGVDHSVYRPLTTDTGPGSAADHQRKSNRIAFLYQPEKVRRAPDLCIRALSLVKKQAPEVEIVTYGSPRLPNLPFEADHRGLISDVNDLNSIYNSCAIGLSISATNPSRIPFEMMAAGCVPVDVYRYNNLFDYQAGTGVLAYQSADSLAEAMLGLLRDDARRQERSAAGLAYMKDRSLEWEMDVAVNAIVHVLEGGSLDRLAPPEPIYTDKPIVAGGHRRTAVDRFLDWQWHLATQKMENAND